MHEMLHAVGFFHEQSRPDRDNHVRVLYENVIENQKSNFNKEHPSKITTSGTPYDTQSIMHYGSSSFSKNGRETIVALQGEKLGRGTRLAISSSISEQLISTY
jgi:hypothetical protein